MCKRCRARLVVVSAVFGIRKFAQHPKKLVACESLGDELLFAITLPRLALENTCSSESPWLFVSVALKSILSFFLSTSGIMSDNAKTMGFSKSINSSLKVGDIGRKLAGNGGIWNICRGT
jgi:hypothetical protein